VIGCCCRTEICNYTIEFSFGSYRVLTGGSSCGDLERCLFLYTRFRWRSKGEVVKIPGPGKLQTEGPLFYFRTKLCKIDLKNVGKYQISDTYKEVNAFNPWKASDAIFEILLLLRSILLKRLCAAKTFVGSSTISFCSSRLKKHANSSIENCLGNCMRNN
jgi:hypothetical protein